MLDWSCRVQGVLQGGYGVVGTGPLLLGEVGKFQVKSFARHRADAVDEIFRFGPPSIRMGPFFSVAEEGGQIARVRHLLR